MNFGYTGDGGMNQPGHLRNKYEKLSIDTVSQTAGERLQRYGPRHQHSDAGTRPEGHFPH